MGCSGAEIVGICRSAGRVALMRGLDGGVGVKDVLITMDDFRQKS
jgi:AAA family ATPase